MKYITISAVSLVLATNLSFTQEYEPIPLTLTLRYQDQSQVDVDFDLYDAIDFYWNIVESIEDSLQLASAQMQYAPTDVILKPEGDWANFTWGAEELISGDPYLDSLSTHYGLIEIDNSMFDVIHYLQLIFEEEYNMWALSQLYENSELITIAEPNGLGWAGNCHSDITIQAMGAPSPGWKLQVFICDWTATWFYWLEAWVVKGDLNYDGIVDVMDIVLHVNYLLGQQDPSELHLIWAADFNEDGEGNILDIVAMVNYIFSGEQIPGDCTLLPDPGPCEATIEKYFYNPESRECERFYWGGCYGNIPYHNLQACENECE